MQVRRVCVCVLFCCLVSCPDIAGCSVVVCVGGRPSGGRGLLHLQSGINLLLSYSCPKHSQTHTFQSLTLERPADVALCSRSELTCC